MRKVRIGIVGLGRLGKRHAYNLANLVPGAELGAACSPIQTELDWAATELGVPHLFKSFDQMLAEADIDAVWIASSSVHHSAQALAALDRGLHVFVEKPMGVTLDEYAEFQLEFVKTGGDIFLDMNVHDIDLARWFLGSEVKEVHAAGARTDCVRDFYERFEEGFIAEAREFVSCIRSGRKPEITPRDGTAATRTGMAMTESFRSKGIIQV
ncbi:MAG: hypothetical protein SAMD01599839_11860 [Rectinema sp.]